MSAKSVRAAGNLPQVIYAEASIRSKGGRSLFDKTGPLSGDSVEQFCAEPEVLERALEGLAKAGFEVLHVGDVTTTIAGPPELYEKVFNTTLVANELPARKDLDDHATATFIDSSNSDCLGLINTLGSALEETIEGVAINEPVYFSAESPFPPPLANRHMRVPGDLSLGLNADAVHRMGITGKSIKVVMPDSGCYAHRYLTDRNYRIAPVVLGPGASDPLHDEIGHGTGMAANVLAVAPDVEFQMVKMNNASDTGAFKTALELDPDILCCSWGRPRAEALKDTDSDLEAQVLRAIARGTIVIFAAGNGGFMWPGQHPSVICVGGVHYDDAGDLRVSDRSSGYASRIYLDPERIVPDVCGFSGPKPLSRTIMLPVEPGCLYDVKAAGANFPEQDGTAADDGWVVFSGTSSAAAQIAGICALLLEAKPGLSLSAVRSILERTAKDVTKGRSSAETGGHRAKSGHDLASGHGLVDAHRAVVTALGT